MKKSEKRCLWCDRAIRQSRPWKVPEGFQKLQAGEIHPGRLIGYGILNGEPRFCRLSCCVNFAVAAVAAGYRVSNPRFIGEKGGRS